MQPEPKKPVVVYRRTPDTTSAGSSPVARYAPANAPLIIGFLILLAVLAVLGWKSANKMTDVSLSARDSNLRYVTQLQRLLDVRLKAINLNNEARVRDAAVTRRELTPPWDVRVEQARAELSAAQKLLTPPTNVKPEVWAEFKQNLQAYIDITQDRRQYNQFGFDRNKNLEDSFQKVLPLAQSDYQNVDDDMVRYQRQANRTILTWSVLAVLVGALVAGGTIWQVQRHFSD